SHGAAHRPLRGGRLRRLRKRRGRRRRDRDVPRGASRRPNGGISLPAGCQDLDGPNALGYVRSRYASAGGDLDRAGRQRQLLSALSKKMLSPGTLFNPFRLFPTVGGVAKSLTVDKGDHMWHL